MLTLGGNFLLQLSEPIQSRLIAGLVSEIMGDSLLELLLADVECFLCGFALGERVTGARSVIDDVMQLQQGRYAMP